MRRTFWLFGLVSCVLWAVGAPCQIPVLPNCAQTTWVVEGPEEIVSYLLFDPVTVAGRLPPSLRFITVKELAADHIAWAVEHLEKYPERAGWGISFIEIVRAKTFEIDGRGPEWPDHGAAALWCARVAASVPGGDLGPGKPFLILEFWMPDGAYAAYMRGKGHYASYADVRLAESEDGRWQGSVAADGLKLSCECKPVCDEEGLGSSAMQVFFPPAKSGIASFVRLTLAGHHERQCDDGAFWIFSGQHPLVNGIVQGPSSFQFGYHLRGGAYDASQGEEPNAPTHGESAITGAENLGAALGVSRGAKKYAEGRGIRIEVKTAKDLEAVELLAAIKVAN